MSNRSRNVAIFQETEFHYQHDSDLEMCITRSRLRQRLVRSKDTDISSYRDAKIFGGAVTVSVMPARTLEALDLRWFEINDRPVAILNFASATHPGGGVLTGATAQEECLCRISTLYPCLTDKKVAWYYEHHQRMHNPTYDDTVIYTPGVRMMRQDDDQMDFLAPHLRPSFDVLTCPAPNLRAWRDNPKATYQGKPYDPNREDELVREIFINRMRRIFDVAAHHGVENLILGAYGCGVFRNPPETVARAMLDTLLEYRHVFHMVIFAIPNGKDGNYVIFNRVEKEYA